MQHLQETTNVDIYLPNVKLIKKSMSYVDKISIGFVAKHIKHLTKCGNCKENILCTDIVSEWHDLIEKEFENAFCLN